jgi:hypothetical protein
MIHIQREREKKRTKEREEDSLLSQQFFPISLKCEFENVQLALTENGSLLASTESNLLCIGSH